MLLQINVYFLPSFLLGHAVPRWRVRLSFHILLVSSAFCPFSWCPLCHSYSPKNDVVIEPCNVSRPYMYTYSLLDNVYDVISTVVPDPGVTFVFAYRVMRSMSRCASDSRSM